MMSKWGAAGILLVLIIIGCVRVVATYPHATHVIDETAHIVTGMEYLDLQTFNLEPMHPPLARAMGALGLYLQGYRIPPEKQNTECDTPFMQQYMDVKDNVAGGYFSFACLNKGWHGVLWQEGKLHLNTAYARAGMLLFFVAACWITYRLALHLYADRTLALLAAGLFSLLPPILGNAGLVITDMPLVVTLPALCYVVLRWLEHRSIQNALLIGLCLALCLLSKFSSVLLVPIALLVLFGFRYAQRKSEKSSPIAGLVNGQTLWHALIAFVSGLMVLWAAYFFDTGKPIDSLPPVAEAYEQWPGSLQALANQDILPMPKLFEGLYAAKLKNEKKHPAYALGDVHTEGLWYYFLLTLAVKTPVPLLLAAILGGVLLVRRASAERGLSYPAIPLVLVAVWLITFMFIDVNAGVRHILFLYPFICMIAAYGFMMLWRKKRYVAAAFAGLLLASSASAHPRYMAAFNVIASHNPSYFLLASDLDYGQDIPPLADYLVEHQIDQLQLCFFGNAHSITYYLRIKDAALAERIDLKFDDACHKPEAGKYFAVNYLNLISIRPHELEWLKDYEPIDHIADTVLFYKID